MSEALQVKFTRNTGNFAYTVAALVAPEVLVALATEGLIRLIQGGTLGAWEKAMAYPGEKEKRPEKNANGEKWTRFDIPFTPDTAAALQLALEGLKVDIAPEDAEEKQLVPVGIESVSVEKYDGAAGAVPKYKAEKDLLNTYLFEQDGKTPRLLKSGGERSAASFAESRGIAVPTEPWAEDTTFLAAVKAWAKAQAAAQD